MKKYIAYSLAFSLLFSNFLVASPKSELIDLVQYKFRTHNLVVKNQFQICLENLSKNSTKLAEWVIQLPSIEGKDREIEERGLELMIYPYLVFFRDKDVSDFSTISSLVKSLRQDVDEYAKSIGKKIDWDQEIKSAHQNFQIQFPHKAESVMPDFFVSLIAGGVSGAIVYFAGIKLTAGTVIIATGLATKILASVGLMAAAAGPPGWLLYVAIAAGVSVAGYFGYSSFKKAQENAKKELADKIETQTRKSIKLIEEKTSTNSEFLEFAVIGIINRH